MVVAGMHRSGTSAVARVLSLLGLKLPKDGMGPSPGNELGHWGESTRIYAVHEELLATAGSSWDDISPIPTSWLHSPAADEYRTRMVQVLKDEYPGRAPLLLKDPRICRLVPFWITVLEALEVRPAFVLPIRNPLEVAASLSRRDGFTSSKGLLLWLRHALDAERDTREQPRALVAYGDVLRDWRSSAEAISQRIGLNWPRLGHLAAVEIDRFLSADQRHHEFSVEELAARADVVDWVRETYVLLVEACRSGSSPDPHRLDELSAKLADADLAYGPLLAESKLTTSDLCKGFERERARFEAEQRDLREKLASVEVEQGRLESERGELGERLASVEGERARLESERGELAERLGAREAALETVTSRLEERDERVSSLEVERARLESERGELGERLASVEGEQARRESATRALGEHLNSEQVLSSPDRKVSPEKRSDPAQGGLAPTDDEDPTGVSPQVIERARRQLLAKPLTVSVVVPTYNRALELRRALSSALQQSHCPLEIIVSDDGSTDGTEAMVREHFALALETGLLRYLRSEGRGGSSAARNAGLRVARGDLIAYLDSDNAWHEHFLLLVTAALSERDDANTAYCGFSLRRDDGRVHHSFEPYSREQLLIRNYVDLNGFVHRRRIYAQLGGFDEALTRLVDWELILRYTRLYPPVTVPHYLVDYYGGTAGDRITHTEGFDDNAAVIKRRLAHELSYSGVSPPRIGYVLWDFPALSQTFVLSEIERLVEKGYDVCVYFHTSPDRAAQLSFDVPTFQVADPDELATLVAAHKRTILHSHFVYPTVTRLTYPAAVVTNVPFTFMVHAVDIFHRSNIERNAIAEIANHELCLRVYGAGEHHRSFLIGRGVPTEKIAIARQASRFSLAPREIIERRMARPTRVVACIARFVEKKGIDDLIRAGAVLGDDVRIHLYGYGPCEETYRQLAHDLNAGCVDFAGTLEDGGAVRAALEAADVFALPCVVDENGDMDGLPTVLAEAMAAGVPVITTDVSSIPEVVREGVTGFVVPPRDPEALARKIAEVLDMEAAPLRRVIDDAQRVVTDLWNVDEIVETLLDAWERPPVDIALVAYSREDDGAATTLDIIRRIYEFTTTNFNLTIVDNGSDEHFRDALSESLRGRENAALILLDRNRHWGPGLNLALRHARSDCLVYVCSREGFVLRPGWEREYIKYLRDHRGVGLAGHLISSPAFPTGEAYTRQPWFRNFRNKRFAELNLDRPFFHIQGGLFGLRRTAFMNCGGFSEAVAQDAPDIEYSYLLESLGWTLGQVPTIPSVTRKTRPGIHAHLDENTVAAHPLSLHSIGLASNVAGGRSAFCNVCTWNGDSFYFADDARAQCPRCRSTPLGRLVYRYLATSGLPFRKLDCAAMLDDEAVRAELERMFVLAPTQLGAVGQASLHHDVVIADLATFPRKQVTSAVEAIAGAVNDSGVAIVGCSLPLDGAWPAESIENDLRSAGFEITPVSYKSRAVRFAPGGLLVGRTK